MTHRPNVPVHFDGHKINIITDESAQAVKERSEKMWYQSTRRHNKRRGDKSKGKVTKSLRSNNSTSSWNSGNNPNAKPFVMCPRAGNLKHSDTKIKSTVCRYQQSARRQKRGNTSAVNDRSDVRESPRHLTDDELIARGFNPQNIGGHDEQIWDDEQKWENENEKSKPKMKGAQAGLFKTELCREFSTSGWCYYGDRCSFAHGLHELRPVFRSKNWRTKRCRNWHTTGYCAYEHRCQFLHDQSPDQMPHHKQSNTRALVAAQQKMKPLYFHYQVDVDRENADGKQTTSANTDGVPAQWNSTNDPPKSLDSSGVSNNPVITQFDPFCEGKLNQLNASQFEYVAPAAAAECATIPFGVHPGTIPVVFPMELNGMSPPMLDSQSVSKATSLPPLPSPGPSVTSFTGNTAANPAANTAASIYWEPTPPVNGWMECKPEAIPGVVAENPDANVDAAIYLNFTPSPEPQAEDFIDVNQSEDTGLSDVKFPASLPPVYREANTCVLAVGQQSAAMSGLHPEISPVPSFLLDDTALISLLPEDVRGKESANDPESVGDITRFAGGDSSASVQVTSAPEVYIEGISHQSPSCHSMKEKVSGATPDVQRDCIIDECNVKEEQNNGRYESLCPENM